MANQKTESMDKAVRDEMMRLLRRGVENPTELTLSALMVINVIELLSPSQLSF